MARGLPRRVRRWLGSGYVVIGAARDLIGDTDQRRHCQQAPTVS
jgi:hypothetical protein